MNLIDRKYFLQNVTGRLLHFDHCIYSITCQQRIPYVCAWVCVREMNRVFNRLPEKKLNPTRTFEIHKNVIILLLWNTTERYFYTIYSTPSLQWQSSINIVRLRRYQGHQKPLPIVILSVRYGKPINENESTVLSVTKNLKIRLLL